MFTMDVKLGVSRAAVPRPAADRVGVALRNEGHLPCGEKLKLLYYPLPRSRGGGATGWWFQSRVKHTVQVPLTVY